MKKFPLLIIVMLTMVVTAFAAPPVASNFSATVSTVGATLIQMQGADPDGTALTFAVASGPAHGTLSGLNTSNGYVVFTPASGYVGTDSFTFTVTSGGQTTAAATATITITNAKTRIVDTLVDVSGNPRAGKVTFILTQKAQSPGGLIPLSGSVSAALNGSGQFDLSVYPSTALSPQAFYQVKFTATGSFKEELIGVYAIPASASTITLAPYRVTDTNLAAQYVFVDMAAMNTVLSVASGVAAIYTGTPANNALQKYDSVTGKLKNSSIGDDDTTVTINNKVLMPGTKTFSWDGTGINAPSQLDIYQGARNIYYPGAAPDQISNGVESGYFWTTAPAYKFYFRAGADGVATWTPSGLTMPGTLTATSFVGSGSGIMGINFSQLSGSVTDAQVPDTITLTSFSQIGGAVTDAQVPNTITIDSFTQIGGSISTAQISSAVSSLGLIDGSGVADRLPYWTDANTLGSSPFVRVDGDTVEQRGTGGANKLYVSGGYVSGSNYIRAKVDASSSVVIFGVERAGSSLDIPVRLASYNNGLVQFGDHDSVWWTMVGSVFYPETAAQLGSTTNPLSKYYANELALGGYRFVSSGVEVGALEFGGQQGVLKLTDGTGANGGTLRFGDPGTKPTCDETKRGLFWIEFGAFEVADTVEMCTKDEAEDYAWRLLF